MATRITYSLILCGALLLTSCGNNGTGLLSSPTPLLTRQLDQPYEWDSELPEEEWTAWVSQQPVLEGPARVVTSVPEVGVVVKYIGRDALASLYTVMPPPPFPEGDALSGWAYETFDVTSAEPNPAPEGETSAFSTRKEEALDMLRQADLIVLAGSGVDDWMQPLITESASTAPVLDLSERMNHLMTQRPVTAEAGAPGARHGVAYRTERCNYWWMSLRPTSLAVDSLDMLLSHMVPSQAVAITQWRTEWLDQLGSLDQAIASFMLDDPKMDANTVIPRRVIIDTPNLAWFCYRWDMTIVDIINTDSVTPPSAERLKEIRRKAEEQYVSMIITTSGYRSPAVDEIANGLTIEIMEPLPEGADATAERTTVRKAVPVVELALGMNQGGEDTEDYVPFMLYNAQKLALLYKPIVDGLYTLKKWHEDRQKAAAAPPADAPAATEETPSEEAPAE